MKKIISRFFCALTAVFFTVMMALPAVSSAAATIVPSKPAGQNRAVAPAAQNTPANTGNNSFVNDTANALTASQKAELSKTLAAIYKKYGTCVAVVTISQNYDDKNLASFAKNYADKLGAQAKNGAIVFAQDTRSRRWNISTESKMKKAVPDMKYVEYVSKAVVPFLKRNDSASAYAAFAFQAADLVAAYDATGKAMDFKKIQPVTPASLGISAYRPQIDVAKVVPEEASPVKSAGIGAVVAAILGYMYASMRNSSRVNQMSNVRPAASANIYLKQGSFNLVARNDTFLFNTVLVTRRAKGGGSSGGVTSNSSDGGHTSGGGGY